MKLYFIKWNRIENSHKVFGHVMIDALGIHHFQLKKSIFYLDMYLTCNHSR